MEEKTSDLMINFLKRKGLSKAGSTFSWLYIFLMTGSLLFGIYWFSADSTISLVVKILIALIWVVVSLFILGLFLGRFKTKIFETPISGSG